LREPNLAQASLAELFAWCIARHAGADATPGWSPELSTLECTFAVDSL